MATYAAYRHVELDNVGYGKKRVLKPPGGGSSDIFGPTSETDGPRRTKQSHNQSSLGAGFFGNGEQPALSNGNSVPDAPIAISGKPGGNPVTGAGYGGEQLASSPSSQQNGSVTGSTGSAGSEKSSTDSSPSVASVNRIRNRVPPGGYSSGLW